MTDLQTVADAVRESRLAETRETFDRRVSEQAERVLADLRDGRLAAGDFAVGVELEAYVVDDDGRPTPVPERAFEAADCAKELGRHNVEINTAPDVLSPVGFERQAAELRERIARTREAAAEAGARLVLDAMWTVPPAEGTGSYFCDVESVDGVRIARNMRPSPRYVALDNAVVDGAGGSIPIEVPGTDRTLDCPSILVESLATSIQPHLQLPDPEAFPAYFNAAVRTMGPLVALSANSPFLPADLYAGADPVRVLAESPRECRIPIFEGSINPGCTEPKVRVPRDVEWAEDAVDRLVADETVAPFVDEPGETYREAYPELAHKRGTYWRWVRAVIGGQRPRGLDADGDPDAGEASIRIEYRPLPTQPTAADAVSLVALTVGLLRGVDVTDHPLTDLSWAAARDSFYAAVDDGLDADLSWVTADGERTGDSEAIYDDLFRTARRGLAVEGLTARERDDLLAPMEARWAARTTPASWKRDRVRERLDAGDSLPDAVEGAQRRYVERAAATDAFVEWL